MKRWTITMKNSNDMSHTSCLKLLQFTPICEPTRSHWPQVTHGSQSARQELSIALFKCTLWQSWKLSTLTFDLEVWPWGLKINWVLVLDHSEDMPNLSEIGQHVFELSCSQTDRQTDKHDQVNTFWSFVFSYVINGSVIKSI